MAALSAGGAAEQATYATATECLDQVMWLIEDSQLLKADELLTELQARGDVDTAAAGLAEHKTRLDKLRAQAEQCRVAKAEFDQETGWQRVQTLFGITTYFKMVEGERNVWVKMEGDMADVPLVCLAAVIREIDLYKTWLPFCSRSDILRWKSRYTSLISPLSLNTLASLGWVSHAAASPLWGVSPRSQGLGPRALCHQTSSPLPRCRGG